MSEETNTPLDSTTEPAPANDPFAAAKASAKKAAEELRAAAAAKAQEFRSVAEEHAQHFRQTAEDKAHEFKDYADKAWHEARSKTLDYTGEAEKYAREKPLQALLTAFGVGLVLGVLLKKR